MPKKILAFDTEVYRNYFLLMFRNLETQKITYFELHEDSPQLEADTIRAILRRYCLVGFNSINYDVPIIFLALTGASTSIIKDASDAIIVTGLKPWHLEAKFNFKIPKTGFDHIDLIEVAPGKASLKMYGAKMHSARLQELPIDPSDLIAPVQRPVMREYCANDLQLTEDLYRKFLPQIQLRESMSAEYGQDLRSKSDAQVAEAVIISQITKITGNKPQKPIDIPQSFRYKKPDFIHFKTDIMNAACNRLCDAEYFISDGGKLIMPDGLDKETVKFGQSEYTTGMGGLHSCEKSVAYEADDEWTLIDRDVTSYYPSIILNCELYPKHIGKDFLKVYKSLADRRIAAKAAGDKVTADALKISINASFGKLGNKWSVLYSPDLLLQTTLTGQLALLMLIEKIERNIGIEYVQVISANTDGIVMRCHRSRIGNMLHEVRRWEIDTGFTTEETLYDAYYARDINSFIAIKAGGKGYKVKGAYAPSEPVGSSWPNPHTQICIDAVIGYLMHSTDIAKTITECLDPRKFLTARQVKGGAIFKGEYVGKNIRWYYKKGNAGTINYKINGNIVPRTEGAEPLMELPLVDLDDINYDWYINEAESMLCDIGATLA